ncbi:MAG: NAD(P)-dependent oxidoreductase [Burkholderiales bacterium]
MGTKILLTGGSGFIGSHLAQELQSRGYDVKVFDRKNGSDVTNPNDVLNAASDCGAIFNLAGVLGTHELNEGDQISKAVQVNVLGALNCLEAARTLKIKLLQIAKPNLWLNTYSITKRASEDLTKLYCKEHGVQAWIVRWFNVFGPGQHYGVPQKLAPTAIVRALKRLPVQIFGDGTQTVDHIYVKDAVRATVDIFECDRVMEIPVEVGSGDDMSVKEFIDLVLKHTKKSKSTIKFLPIRHGEDERSVVRADITLLYAKVGFAPRFQIERAIAETVDYYRQHLGEL